MRWFASKVEAGTSSLSWDVAIYEVYSAWAAGCLVVRLTKEQVKSGPELVSVLQAEKVTSFVSVPGLMPGLTANPQEDLPLVRNLTLSGEVLPPDIVELWTRGGYRRVMNNYGPTEASIEFCAVSCINGELRNGVGAPRYDGRVYILDHTRTKTINQQPKLPPTVCEEEEHRVLTDMAVVPRGQVGEICLGGVQLALGYLNRPEATAEKFIYHKLFGRLYRTGDLGLIDAEKNCLVFRGRLDHQVKVRGFRVELQGVENAVERLIKEAKGVLNGGGPGRVMGEHGEGKQRGRRVAGASTASTRSGSAASCSSSGSSCAASNSSASSSCAASNSSASSSSATSRKKIPPRPKTRRRTASLSPERKQGLFATVSRVVVSKEDGYVLVAFLRRLCNTVSRVVVSKEDGDVLVAFLQTENSELVMGETSCKVCDPTVANFMQRELAKVLPVYAVPCEIILVKTLPVIEASGKVDRKQLTRVRAEAKKVVARWNWKGTGETPS